MSVAAALAGRLGALGETYFQRRYAILFYALLLTMAAVPVLHAAGGEAEVIELFLAATLVAAVLPLRLRRWRYVLLGAIAVEATIRFATIGRGMPEVSAGGLAVWSLVALIAAAGALRFAFRASSIDSEHLYAALDVYVLAGLFFGILFWTLERMIPGSLVAGGAPLAGDVSAATAIYFSFVTIATLGYGDIVPIGEAARNLAVLEAVLGQLYLAVMIARLVSLYAVSRDRGRDGR